MPKVGYSEKEREGVRGRLMNACLELTVRQGVRRTTVEQLCRAAGISRSFFYTFFPSKEELLVEALYRQQPKLTDYARALAAELPLGEAARRFLHECCHGERSGIAVLSLEEQQLVFRRLTDEGYAQFREKQRRLFAGLLEIFGARADSERIGIFTNLCLAVIVTRRAIPDSMPLFVPEAADETLNVQIDGVVDWLESLS